MATCGGSGKGKGTSKKITSKRSYAQLRKYQNGINPRNTRKATAAIGAKRRKSNKVKSRARR